MFRQAVFSAIDCDWLAHKVRLVLAQWIQGSLKRCSSLQKRSCCSALWPTNGRGGFAQTVGRPRAISDSARICWPGLHLRLATSSIPNLADDDQPPRRGILGDERRQIDGLSFDGQSGFLGLAEDHGRCGARGKFNPLSGLNFDIGFFSVVFHDLHPGGDLHLQYTIGGGR